MLRVSLLCLAVAAASMVAAVDKDRSIVSSEMGERMAMDAFMEGDEMMGNHVMMKRDVNGVKDWDLIMKVTPSQNFRGNVLLAKQAAERVRSHLVKKDFEFSLTKTKDPLFHRAFTVGVLHQAAQRLLFANPRDYYKKYEESLNKDLPGVFLSPQRSNRVLEYDLYMLKLAVTPLLDLMDLLCKDVDDKDCNKLVQHALDTSGNTPLDKRRRKAAALLKMASSLSTQFLDLNEDLLTAANKLSSLGFLLKTSFSPFREVTFKFVATLRLLYNYGPLY